MNDRQRFDAKVMPEPMSGCHLWIGALDRKGYGSFRSEGRTVRAHRLAWEREHGPIPDGLYVCHRCDNPGCVNPDHLFLGTQGRNLRDMARRGRGTSGKYPYGVRPQPLSPHRFSAMIKHRGSAIYLGSFGSAEEAAAVALKKKAELLREPL